LHIALNSIKYTFKGSISFNHYIKEEFFFINLKDTGLGMNPRIVNDLNYLHFQYKSIIEGYRAAFDMPKENQFLSGMGLASSSLICRILKSSLFIESKENIGSNFTLQMSCKKIIGIKSGINDETCINCTPELLSIEQKFLIYLKGFRIKTEGDLSNMTILMYLKTLMVLIVDDLSFNRDGLRSMLESIQIREIVEASNGKEAIQICNEKVSSSGHITVFMDNEMPIMDGVEATKIIKSNDKDNKIKIIILSAFNSESLILKCFQLGAIDFCVKLMTLKKLKDYKNEKINSILTFYH